ncbi:putative signal transducing protein [Labilibaculum antarcticum]|uniref:DUF2007 domain-containing protein n=1 Tax=Labilibaculum antarcticum TaxID=1717717 RepID=A0A1Y1CRA7_9BACT|nr:DUF2007 domain-containing protein [Labilibaculum antarcticum]BAX81781.1 hypothetical protein ALGA_3483 [Labilibaculum antarcticum]
MTDGTELTCVFVGSLVDVKYYKERLDELAISSLLKDDFSSGTIVGIGGVPNSVELLVAEEDAEKARACIDELQKG